MICTACKKDKPIDEFYARYKQCITCCKEKRRKKPESQSVTVLPDVVKIRPTTTNKPVQTAIPCVETTTNFNVVEQHDVILPETINTLILECCVRLNKHRADGKVVRAFQAAANDIAASSIEKNLVIEFIESLEVSLDPTRGPELVAAARQRCTEIKNDQR